MPVSRGRRALSLCYLLPYSVVAAGLILLGFAVEHLPFLPAAASRRYRRSMFAILAGLARPVDGLGVGPMEPVAGSATRESAP